MRALVASLFLFVLVGFGARARAQCPPGAPAHDVPYTCTEAAPYLDHIGVCVVEDTGYRCGTSCTVCFCGSSFSLRTPCPPADAGMTTPGPACQGACGPCSGATEGLVLPVAPLLALVGARKRRAERSRRRAS